MKTIPQDLPGTGWPEVYERPCVAAAHFRMYFHSRVPELAMELPFPPRAKGKRRKERATPAEPQHFYPAYFYPSCAGRDFYLNELTCDSGRGIPWLINGSRCLVKSCKSPFPISGDSE